MINKSKLWFLTISSIILVLSIYYVINPSDKTEYVNSEIETEVKELNITSEKITALKIELDSKYENDLKDLQNILLNNDSTLEQKNEAYDNIKYLNDKKSLETKLSNIIDTEFNLASFVSIDENNIKVVIDNKESSYNLANNIINKVHDYLNDSYYITVKFE